MVAMSSDDGRDPFSTTCYVLAATSDYLDGIAARVTGQYSRLGALMDPLIDRLVVISGVVVVLALRAAAALGAGGADRPRARTCWSWSRPDSRLGLDLQINWSAGSPCGPRWVRSEPPSSVGSGFDELLLYVGLAGSIAASVQYTRDGLRALRARNA